MNQLQVFNEIWEERPHISEISGKPLTERGGFGWHWQFSHTIPKGLYPSYRCEKFNIVLMTLSEHQFYENFTTRDLEKPMYLKYQDKWDALFELRDKLKEQYHKDKNK